MRFERETRRRSIMGEHLDKAKGKIKQATGNATGDDKLKGEGVVDELKGHVKGAANEVKDAAKRVIGKNTDKTP
jgi:uncharacterized protein YjbJ (UPF0337 family)